MFQKAKLYLEKDYFFIFQLLSFIDFDTQFQLADTDIQFYDADGERNVKLECSPPQAYPVFEHSTINVWWLKDGVRLTGPNYNSKIVDRDGLLIDILEFTADNNSVGIYSCVYLHNNLQRRHDINVSLFSECIFLLYLFLKFSLFRFFFFYIL